MGFNSNLKDFTEKNLGETLNKLENEDLLKFESFMRVLI